MKDRVNFVTLTYARSGSSFFQRLLSGHPEVGAAQEMLRGPLKRGEKPSISINDFYNKGRKKEVLGFKMMYSHNRPGVWEMLMAIRPKPKVIQLICEDLLDGDGYADAGNVRRGNRGRHGPAINN